MQKINLPTWATVGLSLVAGLAQVLSQTVLQADHPWDTYITVGLLFVTGLGIGPLLGPAFRAALHLSQSLSTVITSAIAALGVAVLTISMDAGVKGVLLGLLTVLAGLGFGTAPIQALARRVTPAK